MKNKRNIITIVDNMKYHPIDFKNIEVSKDGICLSYNENIISKIIEARDKEHWDYICTRIRNFIEENNIDLCFVIDKDELVDCLQEHQKLKMKLAEQKLLADNIIKSYVKVNKSLGEQLAEKEKEVEKVKEVNLDVVKKQIEFYKDQYKTRFCIEQLEKVLPSIKATIELAENRHQMKDQVDIIIYNQIEELKKEMKSE